MQSITLVWDISQMSTEELINDERKEVWGCCVKASRYSSSLLDHKPNDRGKFPREVSLLRGKGNQAAAASEGLHIPQGMTKSKPLHLCYVYNDGYKYLVRVLSSWFILHLKFRGK